ncbi:MAG: DUF2796 domain-containing protein [Caldilineaceae bacterium]
MTHEADEHDHEDDAEHREHGAHVHGAAALMIAWSGSEMAIDLETPAYNVLGFEYTPTSDEEKALLAESVAALEAGDLLLVNSDAECTVVSADVQTTLSEEAHTEEHGHDEEKSPVEHACKHLAEGPEVAVTAAADMANTAAVTGTHIRLDVTLAAGEGYLAYTAEEAGEYIFYADSAITLTLQPADGEPIQPETTLAAEALADCPGFIAAYTFDLAAGDNILAITNADASTESSIVRLVVEAVGGEHEHGEHEHADDEEGHAEEVHSDIDVAYNLTCQQPENIASLDAGALFARFPNFADIEVQWVSDTQQSAAELTPENPMLSFE